MKDTNLIDANMTDYDKDDAKKLRAKPDPAMDMGNHPTPPKPEDESVEIKKELAFDDGVLQKIVGKTAAEVEGILDLHGNVFSDMTDHFRKTENLKKGVSVDVEDDKRVSVELDAIMAYGTKAPEVFDKVTDAISENIKEMTGMDVIEVKLTVKDMLTDEEIQEEESSEKEDSDDKDLQPA